MFSQYVDKVRLLRKYQQHSIILFVSLNPLVGCKNTVQHKVWFKISQNTYSFFRVHLSLPLN